MRAPDLKASEYGVSFTRHAQMRMQQRGIPSWFVALLVKHGKPRHDGHGAEVLSVSRSTRRKLQAILSREQFVRAERYFGVYAILSAEDAIITAAHRTHRRLH